MVAMALEKHCLFILSFVFVCSFYLAASTKQYFFELSQADLCKSPNELASKYTMGGRFWAERRVGNCFRKCGSGPRSRRLCYYEFIAEQYSALGVACGQCGMGNRSDCYNDQCVVGCGIPRTVVTINRQLPGPPIEVCKGDLIVVKLCNKMHNYVLTIHWHGVLQRGTPQMDGVPMITQCPVVGENCFTYSFWAEDAGTYFYHAHTGSLRTNGITGAMNVRDADWIAPNYPLYDRDYHTIFIQDYSDILSDDYVLPGYQALELTAEPIAILINGKGPVLPYLNKGESPDTPYEIIYVEPGIRYRIRLVGAMYTFCPVRVQFENHTMVVIATDAFPTKPVRVDSVVIGAGERYDVVIEAKRGGPFWIHFQAMGFCEQKQLYTVAILANEEYKNRYVLPYSMMPGYNGFRSEYSLNDPASSCRVGDQRLCVFRLESYGFDPDVDRDDVDLKLVYSLINMDAQPQDVFANDSAKWFSFMNPTGKTLLVGTIGGISSKFTSQPLLTQPCARDRYCSVGRLPARCVGRPYCVCPHVQFVPLGAIVQILLLNEPGGGVAHPMHLHGFFFNVLKSGRFDAEPQFTPETLMKKKFRDGDPVMKDTLLVPDNGYAIIRFKADNPGFWLFHCHIETHMSIGMMMTFQVGERGEMPPAPPDFPRCGDWPNICDYPYY